ncbi:MAG: hypothetical protein V2I46_03095, partial [Bacteroides sp.]|nr:hypothetical protein [Bacteroides sp.]
EGEFFGKELVEAFGNRFYSLKYSEVESVSFSDTPDYQINILEINFEGKPEFEKKHLHPSNLFFRRSRKDDIQKCLGVKAMLEYFRENPFDPEKAMQFLYPAKENEAKTSIARKKIRNLKKRLFLFFQFKIG